MHYTLEIRTPRGEFTCSQDLRPLSYHHKEKDLAILHLLDEVGTLSMFKNLGFQLLEIENYSPKDNEVRSNVYELLYHYCTTVLFVHVLHWL